MDEAKARVTAAGKVIASSEQLRLILIDDLAAETDAAAKTTIQDEIKSYEAEIKAQTALKAQAEKEVTRL